MSLHRAALGSSFSTAFVTGASSGLGRAFCAMLLEEGVTVWGTARDPARLTGPWAGPGTFLPVRLDLRDSPGSEAAFAVAAEAAGGSFDLVIHNAGYGVFGAFETVPATTWIEQLETMLLTTLRLNHAALARFRRRDPARGTLVNVSSLAVEFPLPFMSGYNVAKSGLSALSESLIFETRGSGVTVIDFRPGDYRTSFNQAMSVHASPADPALQPYWRALETNLEASPGPELAARDLRRALARGRSGTVRSGGFFQSRLAPWLAGLAPQSWRRAAQTRYFGGR
ncbi:MAG: SDR family NAD(P)-dependent oxidoreductase [Opitutaceae bacterium]|nr:SDR family NAD(P)-dependent oxidoreductase [Opitutaceae bacterium]